MINWRKMCVGIDGLEGSPHGHDVIPLDLAIAYLEKRGQDEAVKYLKSIPKLKNPYVYMGSGSKIGRTALSAMLRD